MAAGEESAVYSAHDLTEREFPMRYAFRCLGAVLLTGLLTIPGLAHGARLVREVSIGTFRLSHFPRSVIEPDMHSPKSVAFTPDGRLLLINALEAGKTFAFETGTWRKAWQVSHAFPASEQARHEALIPDNLRQYFDFPPKARAWTGKPVEMAITPDGRLAYVTSYRKNFDPHGHLASSVSIIDIAAGKLIASLPSGPIPKSPAISPDGTRLVVADWGDNTVSVWELGKDGLPLRLVNHFAVGKRLDVSGLTGNRDVQCGYCLRGTTFASDGKTVLISRMSRNNGLDIVDAVSGAHVGFLPDVPTSLRHLVCTRGMVYASSSAGKCLASIKEATLLSPKHKPRRENWRVRKADSGVRTIAVAGDVLVAAMHGRKEIGLYDAASLAPLERLPTAAWPVGACVSPDNRWIAVTAQGYHGSGGNMVAVYRLEDDRQPTVVCSLALVAEEKHVDRLRFAIASLQQSLALVFN